MKVYIIAIALFSLAAINPVQETKIEITKSLKIINIHDTTDAKILLA